jgi:DNA-binding GntR family transcriptional regulator
MIMRVPADQGWLPLGKVEIDPGSELFPFEQLAAQLASKISSGEYPPGRKIAPIAEIVKDTGLSPMTIRRAMTVLANQKLIVVVKGRGTFVARDLPPGASPAR